MRRIVAPTLDARLETALALCEPCDVCADVGADHGRLGAAALMRGVAKRALLSDVSAKALEKSRVRIRRLGLGDRVVFAVADGLDALDALGDQRADTVFVLGMGGDTVSGILSRGRGRLQGATLVLSVHTDMPELRQTVCEIGYRIRREEVVQDGQRYYILMKCQPAEPSEPAYDDEALWLGPALLRTFPPLWKPVLERRKRLLSQGVEAMAKAGLAKDEARLAAFRREMVCVQRALDHYKEVAP